MSNQAIFQQAAVDIHGELTTDATITVRRESDNGLASLFEDRDGLSGIGNPILPGSDGYPSPGYVVFYAAPGVYKITVASPTAGTRTLRYVVLMADATTTQTGTEYLSSNIASGTVEDFSASGSLDADVGVLDLNPSAGNTDLASLTWDAFPDGAELLINNVHASNVLTLKNSGGSPTTGRGFRAFADLALLQNMGVKVKKSVGANKWLVIP